MKYHCKCGKELKLEDAGIRHYYYNCSKAHGGCGKFYGVLGKRFYWTVPAIDKVTGEIIHNYIMTPDGSYRSSNNSMKERNS